MKVFSLEKFKEYGRNKGMSDKKIQCFIKCWARHCVGQPVHGNKVFGTNGVEYTCIPEWAEERSD